MLTDELRASIQRLRDDGATVRDISKMLSISKQAVCGFLGRDVVKLRTGLFDKHPATSITTDYTPEQVEFGRAMDKWKRHHSGQMPTAREIIRVAKLLGYKKT